MKDLTRLRIPNKYKMMIREINCDSEGYYCHTAKGFYASGMGENCHTIREDNQNEFMEQIRMIEPCKCKDCKSK